jgi:hypothetical protein
VLAQLRKFPNLLPKSTAQTAMRASVCEENVRASGPRSTDPEGLILKTRDGYFEFAGWLVRAGCAAAENVFVTLFAGADQLPRSMFGGAGQVYCDIDTQSQHQVRTVWNLDPHVTDLGVVTFGRPIAP